MYEPEGPTPVVDAVIVLVMLTAATPLYLVPVALHLKLAEPKPVAIL